MVDNGVEGVTNDGDEVTLAYTVTNTGNTCLGNVVVDDPSAGTLQCAAEFSGVGIQNKCWSRVEYEKQLFAKCRGVFAEHLLLFADSQWVPKRPSR